ncbi:MAG: hypothetical protein RBU37_16130 [Myxococcota bacterium]|jgi:hypothetical protein|nr:hypothetical protein [Myxococcota bacterium]
MLEQLPTIRVPNPEGATAGSGSQEALGVNRNAGHWSGVLEFLDEAVRVVKELRASLVGEHQNTVTTGTPKHLLGLLLQRGDGLRSVLVVDAEMASLVENEDGATGVNCEKPNGFLVLGKSSEQLAVQIPLDNLMFFDAIQEAVVCRKASGTSGVRESVCVSAQQTPQPCGAIY